MDDLFMDFQILVMTWDVSTDGFTISMAHWMIILPRYGSLKTIRLIPHVLLN
jgi:hypothetical protein